MARYFFDVRDGHDIHDDVGSELPDDAAARDEALRTSADLLRKISKEEFWAGEEWSLIVADQDGRRVATLRFSGEMHAPT